MFTIVMVSIFGTIDNGSQASSAHKARSSPALPVSVPAVVAHGPNGRSGTPLGYLSQDLLEWNGGYYFTTDCSKAMVNGQLSSGALTNPAQPSGFINVGLVLPFNDQMGIGLDDDILHSFAIIVGTSTTSDGSPAVVSKDMSYVSYGIGLPMEGNVWSLGADNELIPTWINPNEEAVRLEIAYVTDGDYLIATPSVSAIADNFKYAWGDVATRVIHIRLFIEDQLTYPEMHPIPS
ncbi:hypothetical protein FRC01_001072 [Tulasnella sp. 417]|nr:hypothetical protein FRC01_001072 [Tulasnella sp. 417]